ncbi:MAG: hypothetical protein Kow0099_07570 [Candidatus Abyssubacteria bacterium]
MSGNEHALDALIDKLKEVSSAKVIANIKSDSLEKRQRVIDSMEMFFAMVKRNLPRLSENTQ